MWIGLDISSSMLGEWCLLYLLLSSWFRRCDALHNNVLVLKKLFYLLISFYSHKNRGSFYCAVLLIAWTMLLQESLPVCLSVRLFICLSITSRYCVKMSLHFFYCRVATAFCFFHTKHCGNIPTGTLLMGCRIQGGMKIRQNAMLWLTAKHLSSFFLSSLRGRQLLSCLALRPPQLNI